MNNKLDSHQSYLFLFYLTVLEKIYDKSSLLLKFLEESVFVEKIFDLVEEREKLIQLLENLHEAIEREKIEDQEIFSLWKRDSLVLLKKIEKISPVIEQKLEQKKSLFFKEIGEKFKWRQKFRRYNLNDLK